ncbi:2495_t:CDS:2, partial [Cetraspora pellucida]
VTVGVIGLVAGVFLIKNIFLSAENKDGQPTKTPPISPLVYPEEQDDCPYNEKSLTTFSQSRTTDLIVIVRKIPHGGPQINIDEGFGMRNEDERGDRGQ